MDKKRTYPALGVSLSQSSITFIALAHQEAALSFQHTDSLENLNLKLQTNTSHYHIHVSVDQDLMPISFHELKGKLSRITLHRFIKQRYPSHYYVLNIMQHTAHSARFTLICMAMKKLNQLFDALQLHGSIKSILPLYFTLTHQLPKNAEQLQQELHPRSDLKISTHAEIANLSRSELAAYAAALRDFS